MGSVRRAVPLPAAMPAAVVVACACIQAWTDSGSIAAAGPGGWLPFAILSALAVATVLLSGAAARPSRSLVLALLLLTGLAGWASLSLLWSPAPSLARDEGLLTAFYATAFAAPLLSIRTARQRLAALEVVVAILAGFTVLVTIRLLTAEGADALEKFTAQRISFPITYANAQGSFFLLGVWPAILLSVRRRATVAGRALALGAAALLLAGATLAQSKGTVVAVAVSLAVVVSVSPARLRILVPFALVLALDAAAFRPLTQPFRTYTPGAVHEAAAAVLVVGAVGLLLGAGYALVDRRLALAPGTVRRAGQVTAIAAAIAAVGVVVGFLGTVSHPVGWFEGKWTAFKHTDSSTGTTHLTSLGSNRYDFWRVSVHLFEDDPVAGCGARCFGPEYLMQRRSDERPARAHSLPLEVAAEQGIVGLALLGGALALILGRLGRVARERNAVATGALGAGVAWLAHAFVDWTWTFPAVTAPAFVVMGIGVARSPSLLAPRVSRAWGAALSAVVVLVLVPPWLAGRLTQRGLETRDQSDLRWARRLDPVSTAPILVQAQTADSAEEQLAALHKIESMEPRLAASHYFLGVALLNLGRKDESRAELRRALRLDPENAAIRRALELAR